MSDRTLVIGAGFAGLSAAAHLARAGRKVTVFEKHDRPGGRARTFTEEGFTFDMGPSWYWMPDVFERHFAKFDTHPSNYYDLVRLDPSYTVYFGEGDQLRIPASMEALRSLFEELEPGSAAGLDKFLEEARFKYETGMQDMVQKPGLSLLEFVDLRLMKGVLRMQVFTSFSSHVRTYFKHPRLIKLLEFLVLCTWYPMGGMGAVVDAMVQVAEKEGVEIRYNEAVDRIDVKDGKAVSISTTTGTYACSELIGGADYHHVEQHLLGAEHRRYTEEYWENRTLAPSVLMFYLGVNKILSGLEHHTLFFDEELDVHAKEIYQDPAWPTKPLFYVSCSSKTDPSVAPVGMENVVILIPIAPGLEDGEAIRERYYDIVMKRLERITGQAVREHVVFKRSYSVSDLENDMNAYKGNAYGLANTLRQTAILRPSIRSKKVKNLYYTGQLTVPGPGVPPALISGEVVARHIISTTRK